MYCRNARLPLVLLTAGTALSLVMFGQGGGGGRGGRGARGGGPPATAEASAPLDLTGYWVSLVTEDWRFRMVTPALGDYQGVPMTGDAKKVADAWDPAKDEAAGEQCKSYGAPAIYRIPEHLHFTWQDDQTLRLDTDTGTQTRLFHFGNWKAPGGAPTVQGDSLASWEITRPNENGPDPANGSMKVATTHFKAGYLRKNGVPYSANATLTEYYDIVKEQTGDLMLVVTTVTTDPQYLREPFIVSSHFKKQANDAGWKPTPCSATW
jgi:hypothetical protein